MAFPTTISEWQYKIVRKAVGPDATNTPVLEPTRRFNHSVATDRIVTAIGQCDQQFGITMAMLVRVRSKPAAEPLTLMALTTASPAGHYILRINASGQLELDTNTESHLITEFPVGSEDWHLVVVSHNAPTNDKPTFWVYNMTDEAWVTKTVQGNAALQAPLNATKVCFGEDGNAGERGLPFDLAAAAVWPGIAELKDVEELTEATELIQWNEIEVGASNELPVALWFFGQANVATDVLDLTGNEANETSISGTEVLSEGPPVPYGHEAIVIEKEVIKEVSGGSKPPVTGQQIPRGGT